MDFTERNPNQKIPVLRDGDRDIPESCAILQYLGEAVVAARFWERSMVDVTE